MYIIPMWSISNFVLVKQVSISRILSPSKQIWIFIYVLYDFKSRYCRTKCKAFFVSEIFVHHMSHIHKSIEHKFISIITLYTYIFKNRGIHTYMLEIGPNKNYVWVWNFNQFIIILFLLLFDLYKFTKQMNTLTT